MPAYLRSTSFEHEQTPQNICITLMCYYQLFYFIEGRDVIQHINIAKSKTISETKEVIQAQWSNTLFNGVDPGELELLKVNILVLLNESDIHTLQAPEGAEHMRAHKLIEEIWPDQPACGYFNICVRLAWTRMESMRKSDQLSFDWNQLHCLLWGKNVSTSISMSCDDDDEGGLKYVAAEEVKHLKLSELGFGGSVLLIRPEYIKAYDSLDLVSPTVKHSIVITGQPGSGKSCFIYYVLLHRLQDKMPTAFQLPDGFVLFEASGAQEYPSDWRYHQVIPEGTLALADASINVQRQRPCDAFLHVAQEHRAWIVQAKCPYQVGWNKWHEQYLADLYVMNYFSANEIKILGAILGLNIDDLLRIYNKWGPDARNCVRFTKEPEDEYPHELRVGSAVDALIKQFPSAQRNLDPSLPEDSSLLFSVLPADFSRRGRQIVTVQVASNHINDLILDATIEAETTKQIAFFRSLCTHPWFKAPASRILKAFVLTWLSAHPASASIPCTATLAEAPTLEIPVCPKDRAFPLTSLTLLGDIIKHPPPFCFLSTSHTLPGPTIDAIVVNDNLLITVQVTTSSGVYADSGTFQTIWLNLPRIIRQTHKWCHVFVTSNPETAKQLRNQSTMNPPGIDIFYYSAVFEVERLDAIRQRLDEVGSIMHLEHNEEEDDPLEPSTDMDQS